MLVLPMDLFCLNDSSADFSAFFLFLPRFSSVLSLDELGSLRTAGFSVKSKHFSRRSSSLSGPVKMYSHGISMPNPPPRFTTFPINSLLMEMQPAKELENADFKTSILQCWSGSEWLEVKTFLCQDPC